MAKLKLMDFKFSWRARAEPAGSPLNCGMFETIV